MEIQKNVVLTDKQQFRYELLQWCGSTEYAKAAYDFVMGSEKPEQAQLPKSDMGDGVYLVHANGKATLFEGQDTKTDNMDSEILGIGLKMGEFSIKIALHDDANGEAITLTTKENGDGIIDKYSYHDDINDAVSDMNGVYNTNHLRGILNPRILVPNDWYIPSLGEMYRIFINKSTINAALDYAKGDRFQDDWYWTSTENSAANAWYLRLNGGTYRWHTKASGTGRVRAVSAFIC